MSSTGLKQFKLVRGSYEDREKRRHEPGDTVETDIDLNEAFDPAKEMFEPVLDFVPISNVKEEVKEEIKEDGLETLTIESLRKMAEEEEIDLGEATLKLDIIKTIRDTRISQ